MSDDVLETQNDGDNSLKDSKPFKMQCATILLQLKKAYEQVSSALLNLRQRNTYQGNSPVPWLKPMGYSGSAGGLPSSFHHYVFHTEESGSHVVEIVESLRLKAQAMVDASMQAMSTLKEGEDAFARIDEALDSIDNRHFGTDSGMSMTRSFTPPDPVHDSLAYHEPSTSCTLASMMTCHAPGLKLNNASDGNEAQIPSELISSCVATLLMIQTCTKHQYPPADVAQILDSATTSLKPSCSQNLPIYREIQRCMGFIKTRILALVPT